MGYNIHSAAILGLDDSGWSWGDNNTGRLGDNTKTDQSSPVAIVGGIAFVAITAGNTHSMGINGADGTGWAWGGGIGVVPNQGELGNNARESYSSPIAIAGGRSWKILFGAYRVSVGIQGSDDTCFAWGGNAYGQLGTNNLTSYSSPQGMAGARAFYDIAVGAYHTAAILNSTGVVYCCGRNIYGQLGHGNVLNYSSPVPVTGGAASYAKIACGAYHTFGIQGSNGRIYAWGWNTYGQLGTNNRTSYSAPTYTGCTRSFIDISGGIYHSAAIQASDGVAYCWGHNQYGQLGDNTRTSRSSPIAVVGGNSFVAIACGQYHTIAIRGSDGTAWAWGRNSDLTLGTNDAVSYSSPVAVAGSRSFAAIWDGESCAYIGPAAGDIKSISNVAWADILKTSGVAQASISKVAGVSAV